MTLTNEQKKKIISDYRKQKRSKLKSKISELQKNNQEMFKLWSYEKAIDEEHLRRSARANLIEIEKLQTMYDKAATEIPPELEAQSWI